jgi:hypothetical protein
MKRWHPPSPGPSTDKRIEREPEPDALRVTSVGIRSRVCRSRRPSVEESHDQHVPANAAVEPIGSHDTPADQGPAHPNG